MVRVIQVRLKHFYSLKKHPGIFLSSFQSFSFLLRLRGKVLKVEGLGVEGEEANSQKEDF